MSLEQRPADGFDVTESQNAYTGAIFDVRKDTVRFPDGSTATREIVSHKGAVGIVALDDEGRVVLIEQYRPAVRRMLWELPAGILDQDGEAPLDAARRELAEEVGLAAGRWDVLVDMATSPGFSDESARIYLARVLEDAGSPEGFQAEGEEAGIVVRRVPLGECVRAVHGGTIINSIAVAGILAAANAVDDESLLRRA